MTDKAWIRLFGGAVILTGIRGTTFKGTPLDPWVSFVVMFIGVIIIAMTFTKKGRGK